MVAATIRQCKGSKRFGMEPHDAPVTDFPEQPSQKDGLGRMCKTHWNQYTAGLAREAKARKAAEAAPAEQVEGAEAAAPEPKPAAKRPSPKESETAAG